MTRGEDMSPGKVQLVPRGRWMTCLYRDNGDDTMDVLIGAKLYTVPLEAVKTKGEK